MEDAQHAEYDPYGSRLFVTPLSCSLVGRTMSVTLTAGSKTGALYGTNHIREQYYCNFGLNPDYVEALNAGGLRVTGVDADGEVRALELPDHPFYIATLFVPQTRSTPERPHPLIVGFLHSALERSKARLR